MNIGIIGDGQLGRMLALAGYPLGFNFGFLGEKNSPSGNLGKVFSSLEELDKFADVITFESENTNIDWIKNLKTDVFPNEKALFVSQHRAREKSLFESLNIPCAPHKVINSKDELKQAIKNIKLPAILKTTTDGYDGKGQFFIKNEKQIDKAWQSMNGSECILEGYIDFKRELSLIAVRDKFNNCKCYPLVENTHHLAILRLTTAPAQNISPKIEKMAQKHITDILNTLNYVGVLTIELFETENGLVANEIAPRVHNSGHWSIDGAYCSQFENHIRSIAGMPLGNTKQSHNYSAMINIIGRIGNTAEVLKTKNAHLHLYNKTERTNRKLGHINLTANTQNELNKEIKKLSKTLF